MVRVYYKGRLRRPIIRFYLHFPFLLLYIAIMVIIIAASTILEGGFGGGVTLIE
jgi:hypothetical protein